MAYTVNNKSQKEYLHDTIVRLSLLLISLSMKITRLSIILITLNHSSLSMRITRWSIMLISLTILRESIHEDYTPKYHTYFTNLHSPLVYP